MEKTYRTFVRSCTNWEEFSSAEKREVETNLSFEEAREICQVYNKNLSDSDIANGTKMEFEEE